MSYLKLDIIPFGSDARCDATSDLINVSPLRIYNDESNFFSGVFRRSNINITLNNNLRMYSIDDSRSIFERLRRENSQVECFYIANNPNLDPYLVFRGLITEGSTQNDLTKKNINLTVVDQLKYLDNLSLTADELRGFDYDLNTEFIERYLRFVFAKGLTQEFDLNEVFNVFENNQTDKISATIESIYRPSDAFYDSENTSTLEIFNNILSSVNSYAVVENFVDRSELFVKPRPLSTQAAKRTIDIEDILSIENQTNGFNKVYNKISINGFMPYVDQPSIDEFGERTLDITSYAAPSQALAQTYFDYFSQPKIEMDVILVMSHRNLDLKIGERVNIIVEDLLNNFTLQPLNESLFIIRQELNFKNDTIKLRLREV